MIFVSEEHPEKHNNPKHTTNCGIMIFESDLQS